MYIVLLSIFLILIVSLYHVNNKESFVDLKLYAVRLLGAPKYVRLNKFNKVESIHLSPPLPQVGESRCDTLLCPLFIPDFVTCYKCL